MNIAGSMLIFLAFTTANAFASAEGDVKTTFEQFITAQNAHDISAVGNLLYDAPDFLWVTRGAPIWGRDAALRRFESLYRGTWKLAPDSPKLKITILNEVTATIFVPIMFNIAPEGQPATDSLFLMNQTLVKTSGGWKIASILPIPVPPAAPAPQK